MDIVDVADSDELYRRIHPNHEKSHGSVSLRVGSGRAIFRWR